jgi:hypothetical protein
MNARRHGLSVEMPQQHIAPLLAKIVLMMAPDGLLTDDAVNLATRIIEYERTLEQERQSYAEDTDTGPTVQTSGPMSVDRAIQRVDDVLEELRYFGGENAPKDIAEGLKIRDRLVLWNAKARIQQEMSALRYRKRAASQLIKALKGLN